MNLQLESGPAALEAGRLAGVGCVEFGIRVRSEAQEAAAAGALRMPDAQITACLCLVRGNGSQAATIQGVERGSAF